MMEMNQCSDDDCENMFHLPTTIVDHLGGKAYCESCRDEGNVPEGHPQHPEFDGAFPP